MKKPIRQFLANHRLGVSGILLAGLLLVVVVQTVPFARMGWAALTGPDLQLVEDVRSTLLDQEPFQRMLQEHEQATLQRHQRGGPSAYQKRHLVRVNLTPFGLPGFHDIFAVRVHSDVADGTAYTSFLARPGVIFDPEAAAFFSRQCGGSVCKGFIQVLVKTGHTLLRWGVLTPFRLNVTEMDETSSVHLGREAISTAEWARQSRRLHRQEIGRSFSKKTP
jgi:hypothetical protein